MIAYLDTSALVPLLVNEPASHQCRAIWDAADRVFSSRLAYVETAAALGRAHRIGRLDAGGLGQAREVLDAYWPRVACVEVTQPLVDRGAELAVVFGLRGYDAVHCASAERVDTADLVVCTGDRALLVAWAGLGLTTRDTQTAVP